MALAYFDYRVRLCLFLTIFSLTLVFFAFASSYAQVQEPQWESISGKAKDIAVGGKGVAAAIDNQGNIYRYNYAEDDWTPIKGKMQHIDVASDGTIWAVDINGTLRRFTGTQWERIGSGAQDVAVGARYVYVSTNNNTIARYDIEQRSWKALGGKASRVAADRTGAVWGIAADGSISRILDDAVIGLDGAAIDIASSKNGDVYLVGSEGALYQWSEEKAQWSAYNAPSNIVAVSAAEGQIWLVLQDGSIQAQGIDASMRRGDEGIIETPGGDGGSTDPSENVDLSPYVFTALPDTTALVKLSIGRDGSVYGLMATGAIKRWSNTEQRFNDFPGTIEDIAVKSDGLLYAIGTNDNLLEHDGEAWRQVNLALSLIDLGVYGADDRLFAISNTEQSVKLADNNLTYTQLPKQGNLIEAAPDGSYWVIDGQKRLFKCDVSNSCVRQSVNAEQVDIGPGGTIFIVDTNQKLRRYNASSQEFEIVSTPVNVTNVTVGPQDRPWILDVNGKGYEAGFFTRDESADRALATKTTTTKDVTTEQSNVDGGGGGVQIVESVSFTAVNVPTKAEGYADFGAGLSNITVGADDIVLVTGFDDPCAQGTGKNWVYNSSSRSFSHLDYLNRITLLGGVAASDVDQFINADQPPQTPTPGLLAFYGIWDKNCDTPELVTYIASVWQSASDSQDYDGAILNTPDGDDEHSDIDYGGDGSVGSINRNADLEVFFPNSSDDIIEYDAIDFLRIGIGENSQDLWAVNTSYNVYQYNIANDTFKLRSFSADDRAMDVGVGADGTVYIVNMSGLLKKWDPVAQRFKATNKKGVTQVAVDSRGNPIVANFPNSQTVYFGR